MVEVEIEAIEKNRKVNDNRNEKIIEVRAEVKNKLVFKTNRLM